MFYKYFLYSRKKVTKTCYSLKSQNKMQNETIAIKGNTFKNGDLFLIILIYLLLVLGFYMNFTIIKS